MYIPHPHHAIVLILLTQSGALYATTSAVFSFYAAHVESQSASRLKTQLTDALSGTRLPTTIHLFSTVSTAHGQTLGHVRYVSTMWLHPSGY
jgi:hypothetical protein